MTYRNRHRHRHRFDEKSRTYKRRIHTYFTQFSYLLAESSNACKGRAAGVFEAHLVDEGIDFTREDSHDGESSHVEADASARFELGEREGGTEGDNIAGT